MGIMFDNEADTGFFSVPPTTFGFSHTCAGDYRYLIVAGVGSLHTQGNNPFGSILYNGLKLVKAVSIDRIALYWMANPPAGTFNVTGFMDDFAATPCLVGAISLAGAAQGAPISIASTTGSGETNASSLSVTTGSPDVCIVDLISTNSPTGESTLPVIFPPATQKEIYQLSDTTNFRMAQSVSNVPVDPTLQVLVWTNLDRADFYDTVAVVLAPQTPGHELIITSSTYLLNIGVTKKVVSY